jgi:hypothetical protein
VLVSHASYAHLARLQVSSTATHDRKLMQMRSSLSSSSRAGPLSSSPITNNALLDLHK